MTAVQQECQKILGAEERAKGLGLTLDNIESAMSHKWSSVYRERTSQNLGSNEDCNSELRLTAKFNGTCHKYGQKC